MEITIIHVSIPGPDWLPKGASGKDLKGAKKLESSYPIREYIRT